MENDRVVLITISCRSPEAARAFTTNRGLESRAESSPTATNCSRNTDPEHLRKKVERKIGELSQEAGSGLIK